MTTTHHINDLAWVRTDSEGAIQGLSEQALELLGFSSARGQNLLALFPLHRREMAFDMEVALTGWPSRRMATLESNARRPVVLRYTVLTGATVDAVGLYWLFDIVGVGRRTHLQ